MVEICNLKWFCIYQFNQINYQMNKLKKNMYNAMRKFKKQKQYQ